MYSGDGFPHVSASEIKRLCLPHHSEMVPRRDVDAYEVKNNRGKLRCLLLHRIFFKNNSCYEVIVKQKLYKRSTNDYSFGLTFHVQMG